MEKYKICPACGKHNAAVILECVFCEADLTGVRIYDQETEQSLHTPPADNDNSNDCTMIRICEECGCENRVSDRKCRQCGEDISDIIPIPCADTKNNEHYILTSLDGAYAYQIVDGANVIGRECSMAEYLSQKPFVSRRHAQIEVCDGTLYITNLSGTNYTYVNNIRIAAEKHQLEDGDEIGLGGYSINGNRQEQAAYFIVRIESCM